MNFLYSLYTVNYFKRYFLLCEGCFQVSGLNLHESLRRIGETLQI
jgi:hypothetical protein